MGLTANPRRVVNQPDQTTSFCLIIPRFVGEQSCQTLGQIIIKLSAFKFWSSRSPSLYYIWSAKISPPFERWEFDQKLLFTLSKHAAGQELTTTTSCDSGLIVDAHIWYLFILFPVVMPSGAPTPYAVENRCVMMCWETSHSPIALKCDVFTSACFEKILGPWLYVPLEHPEIVGSFSIFLIFGRRVRAPVSCLWGPEAERSRILPLICSCFWGLEGVRTRNKSHVMSEGFKWHCLTLSLCPASKELVHKVESNLAMKGIKTQKWCISSVRANKVAGEELHPSYEQPDSFASQTGTTLWASTCEAVAVMTIIRAHAFFLLDWRWSKSKVMPNRNHKPCWSGKSLYFIGRTNQQIGAVF